MKKWIPVVGGFLIATTLIVQNAFSNDFEVKEFLEEKQDALEKTDPSLLIVEGDKLEISETELIDFKENLLLAHKVNDVPFELNDEDIIEQMLERELLLLFANEQNIVVSKEEILEYAEQTKIAFEETTVPELIEIHKELAKSLNVTPEEYFFQPDVLKGYEEILKMDKLIYKLVENGEIFDEKGLEEFLIDLKEDYKSSYTINKDLIK